jgi:hypothetical protein
LSGDGARFGALFFDVTRRRVRPISAAGVPIVLRFGFFLAIVLVLPVEALAGFDLPADDVELDVLVNDDGPISLELFLQFRRQESHGEHAIPIRQVAQVHLRQYDVAVIELVDLSATYI